MSVLQVVSVYDSVAEIYSPPIYTATKGSAIRSFQDLVGEPKSPYYAHPEHYSLFLMGSFDQLEGCFELLAAPQLLGNAWELKQQ